MILKESKEAFDALAQRLAIGELGVLPTDTVYGLAARVDKPDALDRIFTLKGRGAQLALPVLVADVEQAARLGMIGEVAARLADRFWPGPLTLVVPRALGFDASLGGDGSTVGLRMPDRKLLRALLVETGPLATTSANRSSEPTPSTVEEIQVVFGNAVSIYVDAGSAPGTASTVVRLEPEPTLLREGVIEWSEISRLL